MCYKFVSGSYDSTFGRLKVGKLFVQALTAVECILALLLTPLMIKLSFWQINKGCKQKKKGMETLFQ